MSETELEIAARHVAEGEYHIALQQDIIDRMRAQSRDLGMAQGLLARLEEALALHRVQLARLEARAAGDRPKPRLTTGSA